VLTDASLIASYGYSWYNPGFIQPLILPGWKFDGAAIPQDNLSKTNIYRELNATGLHTGSVSIRGM
jgi:hypothetical protein